MGFYGNVSNAGKTNMVFDKIYSSRKDMDAHCDGDGVYAGRYVLIEYERCSPDDTIYTIYAPASDNTFNQAYSDIECTILFEGAETGAIYRLVKVDNGTIILNEYYLYDGQSYNSLADFDGKTPISQLPGGTSSEANYIINFNKDKFFYRNIRGYDSTVWMKSFYTDGENAGKGYYINIAELNSVVPSFGITVDAPTAIPKGPYFDSDSTNIYYDLHLQPSWGFRVKEAAAEGSDKSDVKVTSYVWSEAEDKVKENGEVDGAIYFNKAGFKRNEASFIENPEDFITVTPGKSGKLYNGIEENDIYELSIQLPSIGNMVSKGWDIIHGPDRKDSKAEKDEEGNYIDSLQGRLNSFRDIENGAIPYKWKEDGSFIGATPQGDSWISAKVEEDKLKKHKFNITHKTKFSNQDNLSGEPSSVELSIGGEVSIPYLRYDNAGHISNATSFQLTLSDVLSEYALDVNKTGEIVKGDTLVNAFNKLENAFNKLENAVCMKITSDEIDKWNGFQQADWDAQEGTAVIKNKPTNLITTDYSFDYGDNTTKNLQEIITDLLDRISTLEAKNTTPPTTE